ncbi:hypothetical protein C8R47DRAFT_1080577 [Mycena vitilis]|nr:hypothetical protein C8R47DRAFT_1080577 [Mycena vitilis]
MQSLVFRLCKTADDEVARSGSGVSHSGSHLRRNIHRVQPEGPLTDLVIRFASKGSRSAKMCDTLADERERVKQSSSSGRDRGGQQQSGITVMVAVGASAVNESTKKSRRSLRGKLDVARFPLQGQARRTKGSETKLDVGRLRQRRDVQEYYSGKNRGLDVKQRRQTGTETQAVTGKLDVPRYDPIIYPPTRGGILCNGEEARPRMNISMKLEKNWEKGWQRREAAKFMEANQHAEDGCARVDRGDGTLGSQGCEPDPEVRVAPELLVPAKSSHREFTSQEHSTFQGRRRRRNNTVANRHRAPPDLTRNRLRPEALRTSVVEGQNAVASHAHRGQDASSVPLLSRFVRTRVLRLVRAHPASDRACGDSARHLSDGDSAVTGELNVFRRQMRRGWGARLDLTRTKGTGAERAIRTAMPTPSSPNSSSSVHSAQVACALAARGRRGAAGTMWYAQKWREGIRAPPDRARHRRFGCWAEPRLRAHTPAYTLPANSVGRNLQPNKSELEGLGPEERVRTKQTMGPEARVVRRALGKCLRSQRRWRRATAGSSGSTRVEGSGDDGLLRQETRALWHAARGLGTDRASARADRDGWAAREEEDEKVGPTSTLQLALGDRKSKSDEYPKKRDAAKQRHASAATEKEECGDSKCCGLASDDGATLQCSAWSTEERARPDARVTPAGSGVSHSDSRCPPENSRCPEAAPKLRVIAQQQGNCRESAE